MLVPHGLAKLCGTMADHPGAVLLMISIRISCRPFLLCSRTAAVWRTTSIDF